MYVHLLKLVCTITTKVTSLSGSDGCTSDWRSGGCGFDPHRVSNILSWRLIMKYFLWSFSPFHWFKKGSGQFLAKECTQYWLSAWRTKPAHLGKLTALDMTPLGWLGQKPLHKQNHNKSRSLLIQKVIFWLAIFLFTKNKRLSGTHFFYYMA